MCLGLHLSTHKKKQEKEHVEISEAFYYAVCHNHVILGLKISECIQSNKTNLAFPLLPLAQPIWLGQAVACHHMSFNAGTPMPSLIT